MRISIDPSLKRGGYSARLGMTPALRDDIAIISIQPQALSLWLGITAAADSHYGQWLAIFA